MLLGIDNSHNHRAALHLMRAHIPKIMLYKVCNRLLLHSDE